MANEKIRVSDYIANFLQQKGVDTIFQVSGGGMMFLLDAVGRHDKLKVVCNHHEQASAMAALTYAKMTDNIGACYMTTGCGGTNALTGLLNAWQDNIACFFITGQSKTTQTTANAKTRMRQFGVQEADIIPVAKPMSKYAVMVNKAEDIVYHMERAFYEAVNGRPGPVWIDVPLDIQGALIEPKKLKGFSPLKKDLQRPDIKKQEKKITKLAGLIAQAKRPVIFAGQGIRLGKSLPAFRKFLKQTGIPFVGTYLAVDYTEYQDPQFVGTIGVKGTRSGNFAMQNADLLIVLGSRLSVSATGYDYDQFAREAKIIVVDIDDQEHKKDTIKIDQFIHADLNDFFDKFKTISKNNIKKWQDTCLNWKNKYPVNLPEYAKSKLVNQYHFVDILCNNLGNNDVVISDAGSAFYVTSQAIKVSKNQRYITSGAQAEMGYTMPAAIGAAYGGVDGNIIGITGEGSFQMNIQELQTIMQENLPIKLFVWNNGGYLSIKATQDKFFKGFRVGVDEGSGISFPDMKKIAAAYKMPFIRINNSKSLDKSIKKALQQKGPVLCEVMCDPEQLVIPTLSSFTNKEGKIVSKPIEDSFPFLDREEFKENMIVKIIEE